MTGRRQSSFSFTQPPLSPVNAIPAGPQPFQPSQSAKILGEVSRKYPGLAKYAPNATVQWGQSSGPQDDRQLEYYPPWEGDNPNPGRNTLELYNRNLKGDDLTDSVSLDMLHYAGAVDPRTQQPVDPNYYAMKKSMVDQLDARKAPWDVADYKDNAKYGPMPTWDDYLSNNRADAYIRAQVSPRMNPEWSGPGLFTPQMQQTGADIRNYLMQPPTPAAPPQRSKGLLSQ